MSKQASVPLNLPFPEARLIQTSDTQPLVWMSESEINALRCSRIGFMDVTETLQQRAEEEKIESSMSSPVKPPLPRELSKTEEVERIWQQRQDE